MSLLSRQSLQNKQCFHNLYAYLSAARNRKNNNEPRIQLLSYHLHPSRLGAFYDRILQKISLPGHYMFRAPILLVTAKGLKGQFRAPCWTAMYDTFYLSWTAFLIAVRRSGLITTGPKNFALLSLPSNILSMRGPARSSYGIAGIWILFTPCCGISILHSGIAFDSIRPISFKILAMQL